MGSNSSSKQRLRLVQLLWLLLPRLTATGIPQQPMVGPLGQQLQWITR